MLKDDLKATRSSRQKDPLSPFLFTIAVDVFSRMLTRVVERGILEGFLVGRSKTRVLYMQFADDTIFSSCAGVGEL